MKIFFVSMYVVIPLPYNLTSIGYNRQIFVRYNRQILVTYTRQILVRYNLPYPLLVFKKNKNLGGKKGKRVVFFVGTIRTGSEIQGLLYEGLFSL